MADCEFDDMNGVDVLRDFDYAWIDGDTDEISGAGCEVEGDSIWLECNGELVDEDVVKRLAVPKSAVGFETVLFICPRCGEPHESLRFR